MTTVFSIDRFSSSECMRLETADATVAFALALPERHWPLPESGNVPDGSVGSHGARDRPRNTLETSPVWSGLQETIRNGLLNQMQRAPMIWEVNLIVAQKMMEAGLRRVEEERAKGSQCNSHIVSDIILSVETLSETVTGLMSCREEGVHENLAPYIEALRAAYDPAQNGFNDRLQDSASKSKITLRFEPAAF